MRTNRSNTFAQAVSGLAVAIAMGAAAMPQAAFAAEEGAAEDEVPVITVTARKREETLLQTPIAITAMSSQEIEQRGIVSVSDLVANTPGVNITSNNSGRNDRSFQQISLRGFTPSGTSSTLTASFIDGVPVSSASALNAITDPARVEVLKGSQNAYFGRNAFAGAINVVNKTPSTTFGGQFGGTVSSRRGYDIQGSIEGPLVSDVLSFRLSGRAFQKGGSYVNRANTSEYLGDQRTKVVSGMLLFTPTPSLTIKAFGLYSRDNDGASAQGMLSAYEIRSNNGVANVPALTGSSLGTLLVPSLSNCVLSGLTTGLSATEVRTKNPFICGAAPALPFSSPAQNTTVSPAMAAALANGAYRAVSAADGVQGYGMKRRYKHLHFNIDWDLGGGFTVSSLTGFNNEYYSEMAELDNYDSSTLVNAVATSNPAAVPVAPTGANGLLPYYNFPFVIERVNRDFSQELRVAFDNKGPLSAMIGANYMWTKSDADLFGIQGEGVTGTVLTANRSAGTTSAPQQVRTYGVFGSVNFDVTDKLTVNLEGRYQRDRVYLFAGGLGATISAASQAQYGIPAGTYAPLGAYYDKAFNNFMPRVIVNYKFTPDLMAYGSWSKAANVSITSFNARLFSGTAAEIAALQSIGIEPFTVPERLSMFEAGLKGRVLDGKMTFALAAYAGEWKDQYNSRSVFASAAAVVTGLANSGRTLVKGVELDVTAAPTRWFTVALAGAINDTNIRAFADPSISKVTGLFGNDFVGHHLSLTSKYSLSVSPQFTGDLPGIDGSWFLRGDLNYKSKQYLDPANLTWIKGRAVVNTRIGVKVGDFGLELFATNLFNDRNYVSIQQNNVQTPAVPLNQVGAVPSAQILPANAAPSLAGAPFSYVLVGLPDLRTVGVKATVKF